MAGPTARAPPTSRPAGARRGTSRGSLRGRRRTRASQRGRAAATRASTDAAEAAWAEAGAFTPRKTRMSCATASRTAWGARTRRSRSALTPLAGPRCTSAARRRRRRLGHPRNRRHRHRRHPRPRRRPCRPACPPPRHCTTTAPLAGHAPARCWPTACTRAAASKQAPHASVAMQGMLSAARRAPTTPRGAASIFAPLIYNPHRRPRRPCRLQPCHPRRPRRCRRRLRLRCGPHRLHHCRCRCRSPQGRLSVFFQHA